MSIRDDDPAGAEADYARWEDTDHVAACPASAPCHRASALLVAGDNTGFQAFIKPYIPEKLR